jgi:hypothetical protein
MRRGPDIHSVRLRIFWRLDDERYGALKEFEKRVLLWSDLRQD